MTDADALPLPQVGRLSRWLATARFAFRMSAFVLGTLLFWAGMEIDFLLRRKTRRIDLISKWTRRWASGLLRVFGIRVEAYGPFADDGKLYPGRDERGVGRIFVMNHRSGADIPVMLTAAAVRVISRHDLANWPLIGPGAKRIGTLFVDRTSRRSGASVLRQISDKLTAGEGIAMFPEGTAYPGDEVHEFKPGAFNAAHRASAQIVPMGVAYGDPAAYYTDNSFMAHMKRIACLRGMRVVVEIGEPLTADETSAVALKDQARAEVERLVAKARARLAYP
jgi:lyso-ornithine lipid O-acyltransferase